jgi:hypothetical protein
MRSLLLPAVLLLLSLPALDADDDFRPLIDDAVQQGKSDVIIPPGTYRLGPGHGGNGIVTVKNAKNLKITATGVTLICTELTRGVSFSHCENVTLTGLTVDYDPLPFTQGKVVKVADDFSSIDVDIDAGYPDKPYSRIDVCDPQTRHRKRGMPFLWGTSAVMVGDHTVRISEKDIGKVALVGDPVSLSTGPAPNHPPHGITVEECSNMTFNDVTVFTAPGFGIVDSDGEGNMHYNHCRVVPGPTPPGASEPRLLSSTWDAIQSKTEKHGPLVENCEIVSAGDDSWSVQSSDYLVVSVDGPRAVIGFRDEYCVGPLAGDRLATSLTSPQANVVKSEPTSVNDSAITDDIRAKLKSAPGYDHWRVGNKFVAVTVSGTFPFAVGDSVFCPDRMGNGFIFRNNKLHSPGRILIKAGDGVIENNEEIEGHSGVTVAPEVPGSAAAGIANLVIRNNHFVGTGYFCPLWNSSQVGSIAITQGGDGNKFHALGTFQNITIEGNRFEDICGPSIVASSTQGLTIRNNVFNQVMTAKASDTGGKYGVDPQALIWLDQCAQVSLTGNQVNQPGDFLKQLVAGPNLDQMLSADAIAKGIAIKGPTTAKP